MGFILTGVLHTGLTDIEVIHIGVSNLTFKHMSYTCIWSHAHRLIQIGGKPIRVICHIRVIDMGVINIGVILTGV